MQKFGTEKFQGVNFAVFPHKGVLGSGEARKSMEEMAHKTHANWVILTPSGIQETPYSEEICFDGEKSCTDEELCDMIRFAQSLGLKVALKPTVNCKNGEWRAYISFFEHDVPCESKWGNWFSSYTKFQTHYAEIAQKEECDMLIAGCEMVMSEHREKEWREVIAAIRECYDGTVSYNTDKYQEDRVKWWDCVDVISSSGYYPIQDWEQELDRIEAVVKAYHKPFFFAEAGCMSRTGSKHVPNNWGIEGKLRLEEQVEWYTTMFESCRKREWMQGYGLWEWAPAVPSAKQAYKDDSYQICQKPVQEIIKKYYKE